MAIIHRIEKSPVEWSERRIGRLLNTHLFRSKYLVVVPNCHAAGSEADLLAVTPQLKMIDVEIKISRSDLRADAKKDKWKPGGGWIKDNELGRYVPEEATERLWPRNIWKHYYAMPAEIWDDQLFDALPSPHSGVVLLDHDGRNFTCRVRRAAKPNRKVQPIDHAKVIQVARLATLRMWNAYEQLETPVPEQQVTED